MIDAGVEIRKARRKARLTQKKLAERLGTTQSAIARWETGRASPTVATFNRIIEACGFDARFNLALPPEVFIRQFTRMEERFRERERRDLEILRARREAGLDVDEI